eukprot:901539_1
MLAQQIIQQPSSRITNTMDQILKSLIVHCKTMYCMPTTMRLMPRTLIINRLETNVSSKRTHPHTIKQFITPNEPNGRWYSSAGFIDLMQPTVKQIKERVA